MTVLTEEQIRKRCIYVGDRIAFGVSIAFLILLGLYSIFQAAGVNIESANIFLIFLWITFGVCFFFYIASKEGVYYRKHVFANSNFTLVMIMWFSFHIPISIYVAEVVGWQQVFDVTLTYLLMYITGYILARIIWEKWSILKKGIKVLVVLLTMTALITIPIIIAFLYTGPNLEHVRILIIIFGIGALIIMGVSALTFALYYGKEGRDVLEDPPSKLICIGIINTMIFNFVLWIILCFMVPIAGGGGGKGKKKSGSSYSSKKSTRRRSYYRRHGYYRRHRYLVGGGVYPRASVNWYWREALGDKEKVDTISQEDINSTKKKIIEVLSEEKVVPTSNDLRRLVDVPHLVFDNALDGLIVEKNVIFHPKALSGWWKKGYTLSEDIAKTVETKELSEEEYQKKVEEFLAKIKEQQPIKKRADLWDLGVKIGIRPRWKVNAAIISLKDQGKIKYSKASGWRAT